MLSYIKVFLIAIFTLLCSIAALTSLLIDRTYYTYFKLSRIFSGGILFISGVKLKLVGLENISLSETYVFASNHSSQFDIPALQFGVPNRFVMVFKKELSKIPLFGWQLALGPYIMIDRKNPDSALKSIDKAKQLMENRKMSVLLFPEGTRSKTGDVQPFKRGAFHLAAKVGYPVVPVTITGTEKILPKGSFNLRKGTITLTFEKPIDTSNLNSKQDEVALMNRVRDIIIETKSKAD
jgi:1-acyl-sn-glycerol-3-phosphate acyltransferase